MGAPNIRLPNDAHPMRRTVSLSSVMNVILCVFDCIEELRLHCGLLSGDELIFGGGDGGVDVRAEGDVVGFDYFD